MWPFQKKKRTIINLDDILKTPKSILHIDQRRYDECAQLMVAGKLCTCVDCPRRGKCIVEEIARHTKDEKGVCQRFVRACSVKSVDMSGDPKCADFIVEELKDYLDRKYLWRDLTL